MKLPKPARGPLYLPIETVVRELDGKLLLAAGGVSRGFAVIIGSKGAVRKVAKSIGRGIWLDKGHGDHYVERRLRELHLAGLDCTAIDEEGLAFPDPEIYLKNRKIGTGAAFPYLKAVFSWGEYQSSILSRFDQGHDRLKITGNPRFDLLRKPFRNIFIQEIAKIKRHYAPYVLVNTRFAAGNYARYYGKPYLEQMRYTGQIRTQEDEEYFIEKYDYMTELKRYYQELVITLAREIPGINVVVRPHPSEEHSTWRTAFTGLRNVNVRADGNVVPWILGAQAVIHTGCTTGIETFAADVPVLKYHPIYNPRHESPLANAFGEAFTDGDLLIDNVKNRFEKTGTSPNERDAGQVENLRKFVMNADGAFAYERMLDVFDQLSRSSRAGEKITHLPIDHSTGTSIALVAKQVLRKSPVKSTQKFPGLSKRAVTTRMKTLMDLIVLRPDQNGRFDLHQLNKDALIIMPS